MITEYNKIKPLIANWVHNEMFQYKDLGSDEVVGVVVSSSSLPRKKFTLNRISNVIAREGLDLIVKEDNTQEFSDRFLITKK